MYNGLQAGQEQVYAKIETETKYVRLVVDFSSISDPKPTFRTRPAGTVEGPNKRVERQVPVEEPYPNVFTTFATDIKVGQILKIEWAVVRRQSSASTLR